MRYSIVVPTRNRAGKLRHALQGAVSQWFDDFEVVVSDNHSTDDTPRVIDEFLGPSVRRVKPPESLSMTAHWNFAIGQARGERVLFLCDDDALLPDALAQLDRIARDWHDPDIMQFEAATYVYADGVRDRGGFVELPAQLPVAAASIHTRRRLEQTYWRLDGEMPKLLNCAVHQRLIQQTIGRFGDLFGRYAPDYSVGTRLLALARSAVSTGVLGLWGENMQSYGAGSQRDANVLREFLRQYPDYPGDLPLTPYPDAMTVANVIYETLTIARAELGETTAALPIDEVRYRRRMLKELRLLAERGDHSFDELAQQVRHDLSALRAGRWRQPGQWWRSLRYRLEHSVEKWQRRRVKHASPRAEHAFETISAAAEFAATLRPAVHQVASPGQRHAA